ncbi:MAG TPA: right-handed parallel beta-helix repeat-containing protein [Candidatus Binatia bacterium]
MTPPFCHAVLLGFLPLALGFLSFAPAQNQQAVSPREPDKFYAAAAERPGKVINVRDFGAKGDGRSDDTKPIQAAIDAAAQDATIKFPAGDYSVANLVVKNRNGLSFEGEGRSSVIRQRAGAERIGTFDGSSDIVITRLGFDANGIASYGGLVFYAMNRVRIEGTWFWDGAPTAVQGTDRYSIVFGKGGAPSQNIRIINNVIDDLQLEVNHSKKVVLDRNVVTRAVKTAGIGVFTVGDNAIAEDYQITNNTVIDPVGAGISVGIDPPTDSDCLFRRIAIVGNQVIRTKTAGYGVRIGTPDNSKQTRGNRFENIEIKNNRFHIEATAPPAERVIFANASAKAEILFKGLTVSGNRIENDGPPAKKFAIELRRLQNSFVVGNIIERSANGMALGGALLSNEVRNNVVEASDVAYAIEESLGGNKLSNNRIVGRPRTAWKLANLQATDTVEK